jgi:hypothetical protein
MGVNMTLIITKGIIKTASGVTFDVNRGDDGLVYVRVATGVDQIIAALSETEAGNLGKLIYSAAFEERANEAHNSPKTQ